MTITFMRNSRKALSATVRLCLAAGAMLALTGVMPASAAAPPAGSYRQSCEDAVVNNGVLRASCQTRDRQFVRARLARYWDCHGDIANDDGRLVCRMAEAQGDIILYEHSQFRGRSLGFNTDASNLPRWFNDIASSIRVRRGTWQVCVNSDYRGHCEIVSQDIADLNRLGMNDRISSLRRFEDRRPDRRGDEGDRGRDYNNGGYGNGGPGDGGYGNDNRGRDDHGYDNGGQRDGAGALPHGSYQQTCRSASMDRGALRAECQDRNGNWHRTSLDTGNCRGDIANDNGDLRCAGTNTAPPAPAPQAAPLPGGSYQQSCRSMTADRGTLSGECKSANGDWRKTSLELRKCANGADIGNDNGELKCAPAGGPVAGPPPAPPMGGGSDQRPLPDGSYQKSCRNMTVEHGTLKGECQDMTGAWKTASVELRTCRGAADIGNDNGALKCAPRSTP